MSTGLAWAALLVATPAAAAVAALLLRRVELARAFAIAGGVWMLAWAMLPFFSPELARWELETQSGGRLLAAGALLRLDAFSLPLPALAAALWLFTVAVTPKTSLDRGGIMRTSIATVFTTIGFLSESPGLLVLTWAASVIAFRSALPRGHAERARRLILGYLGVSTIALAAGVGLAFPPAGAATQLEWLGPWLIAGAALVRKGIFPFHAWPPAVFEHGRLGPAVLFSSPQLGTYVVAVLVLPLASPRLLTTLAVLALVTSVYGAALALVQRSARRACGYLFVSQSSLVMAGLDTASEEALAGALVLWLSSSLAFAGLARCVLVLEARRGSLDLSQFHGGYESKPLLAATFLLLGLTCTGFPGTLGFVGEELLLAGAVRDFPVLAFLVVLAGALTGLAVLRMYFSLFCGARDVSVPLELTRREAAGFAAMVGFLLVSGLAPGRVVASRLEASVELLAPHRLRAGIPSPTRGGSPARIAYDAEPPKDAPSSSPR
jgi:NADH-quinone oxidoreductase subunit M